LPVGHSCSGRAGCADRNGGCQGGRAGDVESRGEIAQLTPTYPVAHDRATVPVNPPPGVMVTVDVPDFPGAGMIIVVGFADMLKSELLTTAAAEVEPA